MWILYSWNGATATNHHLSSNYNKSQKKIRSLECRSWIFWRLFWFQLRFGISSFFLYVRLQVLTLMFFFMSKHHAMKLTLSIQLKSRFLWPQLWYRHAYCADTNNFIISFIIMTYSFIEFKLEANRIIYKWMNECFDSKSNDCPCVLLMRHRCASSDTDFVMVLFCGFNELFIFWKCKFHSRQHHQISAEAFIKFMQQLSLLLTARRALPYEEY